MKMQITISVRRGTIGEPAREKINAKVEKLSRFYDRISSALITIDLDVRDNPAVDIQIKVEPKKEFVAQAQTGELFASLDEVLKKLEQQLKKFKEKLTDSRPE